MAAVIEGKLCVSCGGRHTLCLPDDELLRPAGSFRSPIYSLGRRQKVYTDRCAKAVELS